ncbi:helix-turn-helix domain-containing protein [Rhodopila sp.]|uniref:helix-turn-helix domain-containing protein n=1 Tax=Rhodopila sp. TaxID=2480087 RepID=UPI003D0DF11E
MRRTEALQGVRVIKFRSEFERHEAGELNQIDAAALLGVNERTLRRWCVRFDDAGESGLLDRRLGQVSGQRVPSEREAQIETLYRTRYSGFTAKHFHEHLHQDGSRHGWIGGLDAMDLIVTMDDATNTIYSAFVCPEEGTVSTFQALLQVFGEHGLPLSLYTDRGSHYFHTPRADGPVDRKSPTQVGRALAQLGVEHIAAYSPEARGRSERLFATLQDRLVKELALAGIGTVAAANDFIREVYIPAHNARFAVQAEQDGSAFVAISGVDLAEILCVQEDRQVGHDNTVVFHQLRLQIPPSPLRAHFVKATVKVRRYHDGSHAIFHGPRCLGRYDGHGALRAGALGAAA